MKHRLKLKSLALLLAAITLITGFSSCYAPGVRGAAWGAAGGAIIGNQFGHSGRGAAIGAVSGAAIGRSRAYRAGYYRAPAYRRPYYY